MADSERATNLFPFEEEAFLADPYPFYARLRDTAPCYSSPEGHWVLSRYGDVVTAFGHPSLGNRPSRYSTLHGSKARRYPCASVAGNILPFLDGALHRAQRSTLASLFQRRVRSWAPVLPRLVETALGRLGESFEVMGEFATPLALEAARSLLGLPEEARLEGWSDHFFYLFTKIPSVELRAEIDASLVEFRGWGQELLRRSESGGLLADFREATQSGNLSEEVAVDTMLLLYADAVKNVDTGIANALYAFAWAPDQWALLRASDDLLPGAVQECLRFDSPAQFVARTVLEDFEWEGQLWKQDRTVFLLLASANRDEREFERASELRIDRVGPPHLSFGKGRHACLGGNLFELELAAALDGLRQRYPRLELLAPVQWQLRTGHRWIESARFGVTV